MSLETKECPQCGAAAQLSTKKCAYCKAEFFITSIAYLSGFNNSDVAKYLKYYKNLTKQEPDNDEGLLGLGLCYLQMGTYSLAEKCFEKIIDISPEQSQAYYYYALSNIKGRRVKTISLNEIRKIETYLQTAIQLDASVPQYKLLLAMLRNDYYEMNGMKIPAPTPEHLISDINGATIHLNEIERLLECAKVAQPEYFIKHITVLN